MPSQPQDRAISADDLGIHFVGVGDDILVAWGEIASVDAARFPCSDGSTLIEVYVDHISGVDFRFHNDDSGYEQVMEMMERKLLGFSRAKAEAAGTWEEKLYDGVVWMRDLAVQPVELIPPKLDACEPTDAERSQMERAYQASVSTCEKVLGRQLEPHELECIFTGFENGRIVGNISSPLCELLEAAGSHTPLPPG